MNNKLRLLLTEVCNRNCEGCCNKDWDLKALPVCTDYSGYDEIMVTGGEPMLYPELIWNVIADARIENPKITAILYTAYLEDFEELAALIYFTLDGITLTLHVKEDVPKFEAFVEYCEAKGITMDEWGCNLRLNVFSECEYTPSPQVLRSWTVKNGIEWIKDCPLPQDEVLMRFGEIKEY